MVTFLLLISFKFVLPLGSFFDGACPRKDPAPGVLVVPTGSKLLLTCDGLVKVNGENVVLTRVGSNANKISPVGVTTPQKLASNSTVSTDKTEIQTAVTTVNGEYDSTTVAAVSTVPGENTNSTTYKTSPHMLQPTTSTRTPDEASTQENEEIHSLDEVEEGEDSSRVPREAELKLNYQWKWNKQLSWEKYREVTVSKDGAILSLDSVRQTDAGSYSCYHRGREMTAIKVIVAELPETPSLSCYKKFPGSKIRCEWRPQKPILKQPNCYLLLSTRGLKNFARIPCSYSYLHSRCWCALDHNEDEIRSHHSAFLCVTSILGNATSSLLYFTPLEILKPDPPANVSVHQEKGRERRLRVTWILPNSWKERSDYYRLMYELKYRPLRSSSDQVMEIKYERSYVITDVLPGHEYVIQLRMKEEYDGQWSEWTTPVNATSWIETDDLMSMEFNLTSTEGSGSSAEDYTDEIPSGESKTPDPPHEWIHFIWVACLFALLSFILTVYIFRHKDRLMSKLHCFNVAPPLGDSPPQPSSTTAAPEREALVTFAPPFYKEHPLNDIQEGEENEEEQSVTDRIEAMHFNNTSYFLVQRQ
ncbi:interleukin-6 receptor subunit alpha isoform X2 [Cololabis saira]|uniref:interleukin-6 receptor subunit alpha isoform X2 n=1 Tax=Cololabis saira TaxID=129043 RepID=UPI002AD227F8|nr:interleukin-6 receptor subunit alpha isoform X2 [Cololabis saira]